MHGIEAWTIVGTIGVYATLVYLIITDNQRSKKEKRQLAADRKQYLYSWFKSLHFDENGSQPKAIFSGRELIPFHWIESREEYIAMNEMDKKLLREFYGIENS